MALPELAALKEELAQFPTDDSIYIPLVSKALRILRIEDEDLAYAFDMSRPAAQRWREGSSAPHPLMRALVIKYLYEKALVLEDFMEGGPNKTALIREHLECRDGQSVLGTLAHRLGGELDEKLRDAGLPEEYIQFMRKRRELRRSYTELARDMFPIQSLPDGAVPIYMRDPD